METLYTAHATTIAGRDGHTQTDDKRISLSLSRPGASGNGTNPEQLFACGYSACFGSAVAFVAGQKKIDTGEISVQAHIDLNQGDDGFSISATLEVTLPNLDAASAADLVKTAHTVCPYSKATRGNISVALHANGVAVS